jgi:hypothetical protein
MSLTPSSLLLCLLVMLSLRTPIQAQWAASWCAKPRPQEPLLRDAERLGTGQDSLAASQREEYDVPRVSADAITLVRDEKTCERAARAYRDHLRRFVDQAWPDAPVLVVRLGDRYLVDDLRSRDGEDAYWEVMIFDKQWRKRISYGGGS